MKRNLFWRFAAVMLTMSLVVSLFPITALANSREAIVEDVKGDVYIRKSGGTKDFVAYKGMTLAKGDLIRTEKKSSIEVRTKDSDDIIVVGPNSEVYVSELSEKGEKKSGFKMWTGSLFAKVTRLFVDEDEYTVETPNAVMGVRGTHFVAGVDPHTGETWLMVFSGIVQNDESSELSYPGQIAYFFGQNDHIQLFVDPSEIVTQIESDMLARVIQNIIDIQQENDEAFDKITQGLADSGFIPIDDVGEFDEEILARFETNIRNLIKYVIEASADEGKLSEDEIEKLIEEVNRKLGDQAGQYDLDREVPPYDSRLGKEQEERERELRARQERKEQLYEEQQRRQEEIRRNNQDLLNQIEERRRQQQEENRRATEERQSEATERYLNQLSEEERAKFEERLREREEERESRQQDDESTADKPSEPTSPSGPAPVPGSPVDQRVASIEHETIYVTVGSMPTLPSRVNAVTVVGDSVTLPVSWSALDTNKIGIHELTGTVANSEQPAKLTVVVQAQLGNPVQLSELVGNVLPLPNGEMIDFGNKTFSPQAQVTVTNVTAEGADEKGLQAAGSVLKFDFTGVEWPNDGPSVVLSYPLHADAAAEQVGLFHLEQSGDWRYVPTTVEEGVAYASVNEFSTYGLFTADAAKVPAITPQTGLVNRGEAFTLQSEDAAAELYYKIGTNWLVYEEPVPITAGWSVAVKAEVPNKRPSELTNVHYTTVHAEAAESGEGVKLQLSAPVALTTTTDGQNVKPTVTIGQDVYDLAVAAEGGDEVALSSAALTDETSLELTLRSAQYGHYEVRFKRAGEIIFTTHAVVLGEPTPVEPTPKASLIFDGESGIVEVDEDGIQLHVAVQHVEDLYGLQLHLLYEPTVAMAEYWSEASDLLDDPIEVVIEANGWAPMREGDGEREAVELVYVMLTDAALENSWSIENAHVFNLLLMPGVHSNTSVRDDDGYYYGTIELIELFGVDQDGSIISIPIQSQVIEYKIHEDTLG